MGLSEAVVTCIVGVVGTKGRIILGADSASTDDSFGQNSVAGEKVWKDGEFLFGGAGSWRGLQLARYAFTPPKRGRVSLDKYMVTSFIDGLRETWKKGGHLFKHVEEDDLKEEAVGTDLIVGYHGALWVVYGDLQIVRMRDDYVAIGSGTDSALGALYATKEHGATRSRVLTALRAAATYNAAVRAPFVTVESGVEEVAA